MKINFIGGGNMGEAMLSSIIEKGLASSQDITASDVSEDRLKYLETKYNITVNGNNLQAITGADIIILAIKPQILPSVLPELNGKLKPDQLVLSIIAGTTTKTISSGLDHKFIIRVMPNTPAQIGEGMSVWTTTPDVTPSQKEIAGSILRTIGKEIYVDDEKYLDMATALSGSGPAYFFLFIEVLVEAGVQIGLTPDMAQELALQTMLGSGHLIEKTDKSPGELREMVTSPGGTTAEALDVFENGEFTNLVIRAVRAAHEKAKLLGGELK